MGEERGMESFEQGAPARDPAPPARSPRFAAGSTAPITGQRVTLDDDAHRLLLRAAWLGGQGRQPLVSFSSLFLAFLGGGPGLEWVPTTARELKLDVERILRLWQENDQRQRLGTYPPNLTSGHVLRPPPVGLDEMNDAIDFSPSVTALLRNAHDIAAEIGTASVSVRHLVASYLLRVPAHQEEIDAWGFSQRTWAARFVVHVARAHRDEEPAWRRILRLEFAPRESARLGAMLDSAAALAAKVGKTTIEAAAIVAATLVEGHRSTGEQLATVWLAKQLPADALERLSVSTPPPAEHRLPFAEDAQLCMDLAGTYALATPSTEIHLRHIVAAFLSPRAPETVQHLFAQLGTPREKLARELIEHVRAGQPREDLDTWSWLLANDVEQQASEQHMPGYANDDAIGDDYLSVGADVQAMAAVLAATATVPPLSVGLFGDWGSGKSFFMRRLAARIDELARASREARDTERPSAYCSEIAQIEFNAWHFMDTDLWASLVSHVLEELERHLERSDVSPAEARTDALNTVAMKRAALEGEDKELAARRSALDERLARLAAERTARRLGAGEVALQTAAEIGRRIADDENVKRAGAAIAAALGTPGKVLDPHDFVAMRDRMRRVWGRVATAWTTVRRTPWKLIVIALYLLVPIAGVGVALAVQELAPRLAGIALAVGGGLALLRSVTARTRPLLDQLDKAIASSNAVEQRLRALTPEELALADQRSSLDQQREQVPARRAALEEEERRLREDLANLARSGTLRHYILDRAASDDYRKRLGVIATVHRDFKNLSDRLRSAGAPHVQRIVLYIDDLDRCPPDRVVQILQAIHLILSFPLFVVVVGVDSGWLLRSLEAYYDQQFGDDDGAARDDDWESRPQHYLEKIFQIPYTLRPMSSDGFGALVDGLIRASGASPTDAPRAAPAVTVSTTPATASLEAAAPPTPPGPAAHATPRPASPVTAPPAAPLDLSPRSLEVTAAELVFLRGLAPLVGSPRAAKRLVNLYRIVRAGFHGAALEAFLDERFKLTQLCLATVVGCPDFAVTWFEPMLRGRLADTDALFAHLDSHAALDPRIRFLTDHLRACPSARDWPHLLEVCRSTARYSFETGRLLRPQRRPRP